MTELSGLRARRPLLLLLALAGLLSCDAKDEETAGEATSSSDATTLSRQTEQGPVFLTVSVSPSKARLSDELELVIVVRAEPGIEVEPPVFGGSYGELSIVDMRRPLPRETDAGREWRFEFRLEPNRTGRLTIDPIPVRYVDRRGEEEVEGTIDTEGLEVEIESVIESGLPSLEAARPPAPPLELPAPEQPLWPWLTSAGALLLLGIGGMVWWRRRETAAAPLAERSPRELAYLELEALMESRLAERDVKAFYVELTAIVRRYIERTHGVHAPEQTTEEFLAEIASHPDFSDEERGRLGSFLESADLVKFAAFQPRPDDVETSFDRAQAFVGFETEEVPA